MLRRALLAEQFALRRFQDAFEHLSALCGLGIGDARVGYGIAPLCIPGGVGVADAQCRLRDEAEAAPFKVGAEFEDFGHDFQGGVIAFPWNDALVLIFNFGFAGLELPEKHHDGLEQIERLESRSHYRLAFVSGDPLVGAAADDSGDVSRSDESIKAHVG